MKKLTQIIDGKVSLFARVITSQKTIDASDYETGDVIDGWTVVEHAQINSESASHAGVPLKVAAWQAKRALAIIGMYKDVSIWASSASTDTQIMFNDAPTWYRHSAFIDDARIALNKTAQDIDQIFVLAATIT